MVHFENEICEHLSLPSIPLKAWDKKSSFKYGVAITTLAQEEKAYAVCTFDSDIDKEPRIIKTFAQEPFYAIEEIFVVPSYMDTIDDVAKMDIDEESKKAAKRLAEEAEEMTKEEEEEEDALPENEWCFDEIHNIEEARAYLSAYNTRNRIKGKIPKNEETIKLRLLTIWKDQQNKKK